MGCGKNNFKTIPLKTKIIFSVPEFFSAMTTVECRSWAAVNASKNSIENPILWHWQGLLNRTKKTNNFQ